MGSEVKMKIGLVAISDERPAIHDLDEQHNVIICIRSNRSLMQGLRKQGSI